MNKRWRKLARRVKRERLAAYVLWRDANTRGAGGWVYEPVLTDDLASPEMRIESIGWLRQVRGDYLTLIQGHALDNTACDHLQHIPLACVIELRLLDSGKPLDLTKI